ncbi:hypothetical protein ACIOD2_25780 [Amycolatopsis sp. NPDC088138]|uniref:hypothetical protein n=1 Tax=Amycolatopsis sp. NPDC088138 TaxID=3363938 RepID=UPI0038055F53
MSDAETATQQASPFRPEWGTPPRDEQQRAAWLLTNVRAHIARRNRERINRVHAMSEYASRMQELGPKSGPA